MSSPPSFNYSVYGSHQKDVPEGSFFCVFFLLRALYFDQNSDFSQIFKIMAYYLSLYPPIYVWEQIFIHIFVVPTGILVFTSNFLARGKFMTLVAIFVQNSKSGNLPLKVSYIFL